MTNTPEENFLELLALKDLRIHSTGMEDALDSFRELATEYAFIPRADMPVLDDNGNASQECHKKTNVMQASQKFRRYAASALAYAEYLEAKEQQEADAKAEDNK